jgi:four helix bundle protein
MVVNSYRDLIVWRRAMDVVERVYRAAAKLPKAETYGLVSQLQRSAVSIPSNIAEGHARRSKGDFERFVAIALGSAAELETQLMLAKRLNYLEENAVKDLLSHTDEVARMLRSLHRNLHSRR